MTLTPQMFLIVCPLLFLGGLVDAIGGGGGLITLPAYLLSGVPVHQAIATLATVRFIREGLVNWRLAIPTVIMAVIGSSLGANVSLRVSADVMEKVLIFVLPLVAVVVLSPRLFRDGDEELKLNGKTWAVAIAASLLIGFYDGFYGPGTGTFLIIAFTVLAGINPRRANAQAKVINLSSNIAGLTVFILNGQVFFPLGIAAAVCNMAGNYVGAGLAITKGSRITRPVIILVLALLFLKILGII